jgi:Spy/CpxP family protein refolding chaperone
MRQAIRFTLFTAGLWAGCFLSVPAHAQFFSEHHGQREKMEERIAQIYGQLDLTEQQKELLKQNKERHKAAKAVLLPRLKEAMQLLGEELKKKDIDQARISSLQATLKDLRNQMMDERFAAILEVRKILTQEQFIEFSGLLEREKEDK